MQPDPFPSPELLKSAPLHLKPFDSGHREKPTARREAALEDDACFGGFCCCCIFFFFPRPKLPTCFSQTPHYSGTIKACKNTARRSPQPEVAVQGTFATRGSSSSPRRGGQSGPPRHHRSSPASSAHNRWARHHLRLFPFLAIIFHDFRILEKRLIFYFSALGRKRDCRI